MKQLLRGFGRPLALLLAVLVCFVLPAASAVATGTMQIYVFHDRNNDARLDTSDLAPQSGVVSLGWSGGQGYETQNLALEPGSGNARVFTVDTPTGVWRLQSLSIPQGYRLGRALGLEVQGSGYATYGMSQLPGVSIAEDRQVLLYIPLLLDENRSSVEGRVVWADNSSPVQGAAVELLSGDSALKRQSTGPQGDYQFAGLEPGSYRVRVTAPQGDGSLQLAPTQQTGGLFIVLDGQAVFAPDTTISRSAWVRFVLDGAQVAEYPEVTYGGKIAAPIIPPARLEIPGGFRSVTGWYKDEAHAIPWSFESDAVTANTTLYASYNTSYYERQRGGSSKDRGRPPVIKTAQASYDGSGVRLSVEMDGGFPVFSYAWQMREQEEDPWTYLPQGDSASCTVGGVRPGADYAFRVQVTRGGDGLATTSDLLRVRIPTSAAGDDVAPGSTGLSVITPPRLPTPGLEIRLSSGDTLFEGARTVAEPSEPDGEWSWDEAMLSRDPGTTTFTALQPGETLLRYQAGGKSSSATIKILPASLPATGQSVTAAALFAATGAACMLGALALHLRRERGRGDE